MYPIMIFYFPHNYVKETQNGDICHTLQNYTAYNYITKLHCEDNPSTIIWL